MRQANYKVAQEDLRVIRPLTFVRERDLRAFAAQANLPVSTHASVWRDDMQVISENCPACFEAPKERVRCKQVTGCLYTLKPLSVRLMMTVIWLQLLAAQEHQSPQLFNNLKAALLPMLSIDNAKPDHQAAEPQPRPAHCWFTRTCLPMGHQLKARRASPKPDRSSVTLCSQSRPNRRFI